MCIRDRIYGWATFNPSGIKCGSSIYLTTKGPNDQISPANKTTGTAIFGFLSWNILRYLIVNRFNYNKNDKGYNRVLLDWLGKKQSTISPFLKFDLPEGNKAQILDFTNDLILNDSWPWRTSTSIFPFLVVLNLLFANLVKFFFLVKLLFKIALKGFSSFSPKIYWI